MTSTYTANNGIEKIETGDQSGTWGETTNTNFDIIDRALNGVGSITLSGTSHTLTTTDGSLTDGMFKVLSLAGSPTGTNTITISPNDQDKLYFVKNASGQSAVFSQGTGANVTIPNGNADIIFADGAGSGAAVSSLFADDVIVGDDLTLNSDDAVIGFGADTDIKIIHDPDDGLFFKSVATGDDNPFVLTIQTGETDIAADDKLGVIDFQAPDEGAGTDAILVAAGIEAISEGDFAADSNATSLVFKTGASEAATEKVRITSAGLVGIAATSPSSRLSLGDSTVNSNNTITFGKRVTSAQSNLPLIGHDSSDGTASDLGICATSSAGAINFYTGNDAAGFGNGSNDLRMVINSSGNVGIGVAAPAQKLDVDGSVQATSFFIGTDPSLLYQAATDTVGLRVGADGPFMILGQDLGSSVLGVGNASSSLALLAGSNEAMRIVSSTLRVGINNTAPIGPFEVLDVDTSGSGGEDGFAIGTDGRMRSSSDSSTQFDMNDTSAGGGTHNYIVFRYHGTAIGDIDTTNNSTIRYNTFTGAHWAQWSDHTQPDIKLGTVISTINEMCNYTQFEYEDTEGDIQKTEISGTFEVGTKHTIYIDEDGKQAEGTAVSNSTHKRLAKVKVSDVAGDKTVYGVFAGHYKDGDSSIESLGLGIIRIASGVTVATGDLLESAGDGTARPQTGDTADLFKSSTIAKVTSTVKGETYEDGSYTIPCTLHCG